MVSLTSALSAMALGGALYGTYDRWSTPTSSRSVPGDFNTHIQAPEGSLMSTAVLSNPEPPKGGFSRCLSQMCDGSFCLPGSEQYGLKASFGPEDHGSAHRFAFVVPPEGDGKPVQHFVSSDDTRSRTVT